MIPGSTNILDQLLGGFETQPTGLIGPAGASIAGEPQGLRFGDLLLAATNGEMVAETGELQVADFLFPSSDQPVALDNAPAGPTATPGSLTGSPAEAAGCLATLFPNIENVVGRPADPSGLAALRSDEASPRPLVDFPANHLPLIEEPLKLETGVEAAVYRVLDSRVSEGRLELTVAPEGQTREPVRISVPVALLSEPIPKADSGIDLAQPDRTLPGALTLPLETVSEADGGAGVIPAIRASRVPINGVTRPESAELDVLLSKLNLKTLEIKVEPEGISAKPEPAPVRITLVAESDGAQIALKGKLSQQDIRVRTKSKPHATVRTGNPDRGNNPTGSLSESSDPRPVRLSETILPRRAAATSTMFDLPDRLHIGQKQAALEQTQLTLSSAGDRNTGLTSTEANRNAIPAVRLTLPESIQKPFHSGGQTIMIRIEPEHLGPARLNLAVRDQMLTARVVVETPIAKLAVENSLRQLTDQLSRGGIEVDRIEVSLSGDSAREQFFDRRPLWSHARTLHRFEDKMELGAELAESTPIITPRPQEYIGANGVNLLA